MAEQPLINFTEGRIHLGARNIRTISNFEELSALVREGLIEERENGRGKNYFYVKAAVNGMRFGVLIGLRQKRIDWLRLDWLDSPIRGWDDFSEERLRAQYRLLWNFVKQTVGRQPDLKENGKRAWRFPWGRVEVCYEPRAALADIFMVPRHGQSKESSFYA